MMRVSIAELDADEAEELGHDPTLRDEVGPLVRVTYTTEGCFPHSFVAILEEASVQQEHITT